MNTNDTNGKGGGWFGGGVTAPLSLVRPRGLKTVVSPFSFVLIRVHSWLN